MSNLIETNLEDINIDDVNYFLKTQNIPIKNNPYLTLWNFLIANKDKNILVPVSIADWVLAYNIKNIPNLSNEELSSLLNIFDKKRITRILSYLKTNRFNDLPEEVIIKILLTTDCKDIPKLCQSSSKFRNLCNSKFIPYFKEKLNINTGLKVDNYNFQQLIYLCQQQKYRQYNKIATGNTHTLIISDGKVYSCGKNVSGELGLGENVNDIYEFSQIPELNNIIEVAAGSYHSLALDINGKVYSFGDNEYGQLGLGNKNSRQIPTLIPNLPKIISISAAVNISAILSENGQVFVFGKHIGKRNDPDVLTPKLNTELSNIVQISLGNGYLLALDNNGIVYGYGEAGNGQIIYDSKYYIFEHFRDAKYPPNIMYITTGNVDSFAIDINGKLYSHGEYYQKSKKDLSNVPLNFKVNRVYPSAFTMTGGSETNILVLSETGEIYDIDSVYDEFTKSRNLEINKLDIPNIIYVKRGEYSKFLVDINGNLYVQGENTNGQLGLGHNDNVNVIIFNPNIKLL